MMHCGDLPMPTRVKLLPVLLLVLAGLIGAMQPAASQVQIRDVELAERSDGRGHVLRVEMNDRIEAFSMPEQPADASVIEWTIYNAVLSEAVELPSGGPVAHIDTEVANGHFTFRIHLAEDATVQADAYRDGASDDLLLNLATEAASAGSPTDREASGEAARSTRDIVESARQRWQLDTIVIDPGHGGQDHGATANGVREKDIVLSVSQKLGGYLEEYLGIEVLYTRDDDTFVELEERGRFANEHGAKLFISIHANAAASSQAYGTETFFLGPSKTESARRVMERENSVIRYEDNTDVYDAYDDQQMVRATLTQSAYLRQSQDLAALIESQFSERVNRRSRGVKQAPFYVLWGASMPAVLVEMGFISNRSEANFLASEQGQTYMASAIFRAVREYKSHYERGMTPVAGE